MNRRDSEDNNIQSSLPPSQQQQQQPQNNNSNNNNNLTSTTEESLETPEWIEVFRETIPHNNNNNNNNNNSQFPLVSRNISTNSPHKPHTRNSSITVKFPPIQLTHNSKESTVVKEELHSINIESVLVNNNNNNNNSNNSVFKKKLNEEKEKIKYPIYNVRPVIRQEDHPLWSNSLAIQEEYLFGNSNNNKSINELDIKDIVLRTSLLENEFNESSGELYLLQSSELSNMKSPMLLSKTMTAPIQENIFKNNNALIANQNIFTRDSFSFQQKQKKLKLKDFNFLIPNLFRDECINREFIIEAERYEAIRYIPLPPHLIHIIQHPALVSGIEELILKEEIIRNIILKEEIKCFEPIYDFFIYSHRAIMIGSKPLEHFIQRYIWKYKGRKERERVKREQLLKREAQSRGEIIQEYIRKQGKLFTSIIIYLELLFRNEIVKLQLTTQYAYSLALIRLKEQIELFPLLYGAIMPRAIVCGRISGTTIFKQLDLHVEYKYIQLNELERGERTGIYCKMMRDELVQFHEVEKRGNLILEECMERVKLNVRLFFAKEHWHRREIEIMEACEREIELERNIFKKLFSFKRESEKYEEENKKEGSVSMIIA